MAERIYNLTNEANPTDDVVLVIDNIDYTEAQQTTKAQLFADEVTDRTDADNNIIDGAGLNADGSMSPDPGSSFLQNADFLAAGYDVNLRNGLRLLDTAITDVAADNETTWQIDLTSAEILALGAALTKIAASGIGNQYHIFECDAYNNFKTAAYASAGAAGLDVIFHGGADQIVRLPVAFLEAAADLRFKFLVASHELLANTAIDVIAPDGNPVNGDGEISIRLRGMMQQVITFGGAQNISPCCIQPLADSFVDADLTALGNLEIYHGFNTLNVLCIIFDNTNAQVAVVPVNGDEGGADTMNYITVPIGAGIPGTWRYLVFIAQ